MSKLRIFIIAASALGAAAVLLGSVLLSDLPPAPNVDGGLAPNAYDEKRLEAKLQRFLLLARQHKTITRVGLEQELKLIIGDSPTPEDLGVIANWAERADPWMRSGNTVYDELFYGSIGKLVSMKSDSRAAYALWKIREGLVSRHRWDGHLAEVIEEGQSKQRQ
ncbi:MAG: hypothetical protein K2W95_01370 [Candidatus Obscuribacterales bacterium]|nr:hypothetical protein [Candidatus Obscuribacterales bacterium]